jgi:hypothetical protein
VVARRSMGPVTGRGQAELGRGRAWAGPRPVVAGAEAGPSRGPAGRAGAAGDVAGPETEAQGSHGR